MKKNIRILTGAVCLIILLTIPVLADVKINSGTRTYFAGVEKTNCHVFGELESTYFLNSYCKAAMDTILACTDTCCKNRAAENPRYCGESCEYECTQKSVTDPNLKKCMSDCPRNSVPLSDVCPSDRAVTKDCCCLPEFSRSYSECVPKADLPGAIFCGKNGCQRGENCAVCPEDCQCSYTDICDPFSTWTNPETYCSSDKYAYVFESTNDVSRWEAIFLYFRNTYVTNYFRFRGYKVQSMKVSDISQIAEYLANPSTKAIAYLGHAGYAGELEGARIDQIKNAISAKSKHKWAGVGVTLNNASERGAYRANNLNLEEAYIFACYSLDTTELADYLLKPGGTFWGQKGGTGGCDRLQKYVKPL